jgi:hypothetical protein
MNWRRFFLPSPENGYTSKLLQRTALLMMTLLILLSFATVNIQTLLWQSSDWLVGAVLPAVVVDLTNTERNNLNEVTLVRNATLDAAAQAKAEHMAKNQYFAHYSPDGVSPWYWFEKSGYVYAHAGENLAIHFRDSGALVDAWMKSPTHRANIANGNYTEIGVGTAKGMYEGFDTVYVVQLFGTPAARPAPVPAPTPVPSPIAVALPPVEVAELATGLALVDEAEIEQVAGDSSILKAEIIEELPVAAVAPAPAAATIPAPTPASDLAQVPEPAPIASASGQEPFLDVEAVTASESGTALFSTHYATTSGLVPLSLDLNTSGSTETSYYFLGSIATQPNTVLQFIYLIIGIIVASLLFASILLSVTQHNPRQVVYGVLLLILMSGLFYVHVSLTSSVVIASELGTPVQEAI